MSRELKYFVTVFALLFAQWSGAAFVASAAWQLEPGKAQDIAIGAGGQVGVVDPQGVVRLREPDTGNWRGAGSGMRRIAVAPDGSFWGVDEQARLLRLSGSVWQPLGTGALDLAVAPDGTVLVATNRGTLAQFDPVRGKWAPVPGSGQRVTVDARGLLWRIDAEGRLSRRLADVWVTLPGLAKDLAADPSGPVIMVGVDGFLYLWSEEQAKWSVIPGTEQSQAAAALGRQLWRVNEEGRILVRGVSRPRRPKDRKVPDTDASTPPETVPSGTNAALIFREVERNQNDLARLAIGQDGSVYALTREGNIRRWSNAEDRFNDFPGQLRTLRVSPQGLPYGIGSGGAYVYHDGGAWRTQRLKFPLADVSQVVDAPALVVNDRSLLFRVGLNDPLPGYQRLSGMAERAVATRNGGYWYVDRLGQPFECDALGNCTRYPLRVIDFAVGPGGTAFAVDERGNLHRFNLDTRVFEIVRRGNTTLVAVGPGDQPWIVDGNGIVLATQRFPRDESGDRKLSRGSASTADVTIEPPASVVFSQALVFTHADIPISASGFPSLGSGMLDLTVGLDDQVIVTGFDSEADPCQAASSGWKGRNWIYSPTLRKFLHLDSLKQVQYQVALAGRDPLYGFAEALPTPAGAPTVPIFYGSLRGCERYFTVVYDSDVFENETTEFFEMGGRAFLQSNLPSSALTVDNLERTLTIDMDLTLDNVLVGIFPERKINIVRLDIPGFEIIRYDQQKFDRVGVGATTDVMWATDFYGDVFQFIPSTQRFEKRNLFLTDRAQDIGVGKDGSVFIVDQAGRLKKWNPVLKSFETTGKVGVSRVAVTSAGKPVVANFPASQRVFFAR